MNQDEINTNAAAGAAASAAALVFTTAFAVATTVAAAEAAAPAAAFVLVSDWFLTGFRLVFRLVLTGFRLVFRLGGGITMLEQSVDLNFAVELKGDQSRRELNVWP